MTSWGGAGGGNNTTKIIWRTYVADGEGETRPAYYQYIKRGGALDDDRLVGVVR